MKTLLFGLDGATYTVLDPLVARGVMPNLKRVYTEGARSALLSTPMPLTPPAWTSLATGRSPGQHGIHDFIRPQRTSQGIHWRINDSRDNHCETLWEYASRCGQQVTILNYIATSPPLRIKGHSIPGFTSGRHLRRSTYPRDLFERLEKVKTIDVKALGLDYDVERRALQDMNPDEYEEFILHHVRREQIWFDILEHLMIEEPSELTAIVFDGVDKIQHAAYRFLDPAIAPRDPSPWEARVIELCIEYFAQVDAFLGRALELVGPGGRVFLASDHGFTATTQVVYINRWLESEGLLHWRDEVEQDDKNAVFSERLADLSGALDLERTKAYALTPSCNGIFIDVPEDEYAAFRDDLVARLLAIRDGEGRPVISEARTREDAFPGPYMDRAPDLTLTLSDYGLVSVLNGPAVVVPREQPAGTHHPHGVLMGIGPGVRRGAQADLRGIMDVAPLLAHSLGLEIPVEYEGEFPASFYEADYLQSDPPRVAQASAQERADDGGEGGARSGEDAELDESEEQAVFERLRSLGYIE